MTLKHIIMGAGAQGSIPSNGKSFSVEKNQVGWAVVVVKWSAWSPSISTIRFGILRILHLFSVKFVFEKNEKTKRGRVWPI